MKRKSIALNAILNVLRQGLSILFPLITYPYALHVLGPEGMGKVSYGQAIVSFFALFAEWGIFEYMIREGSRKRENQKELSNLVNEVHSINVVLTVFTCLLIILALAFVPQFKSYRTLIFLQSLVILFNTFSVDWINTIYEDFLRIAVRTVITYVISFALMFLLVRDKGDYYQYALLTVLSTVFVCISNRIHFRKFIKIKFVRHMNIKKHIRPLFTLFANSIAITVNTNFDVAMLGGIKGDYSVGIYTLGSKVYSVIRNIICAVFRVAIPRLSYLAGDQQIAEYRKLNTTIWNSIMLIMIPAAAGLISQAGAIARLMGGGQTPEAISVLQILSITLIFATMSDIIMSAMNISLRREKENLIATFLSAVINIGLNFVMIPHFSYDGAAFTTLISEGLVFIFLMVRFPDFRKYLDIKSVVKESIHAGIGSLIIAINCTLIGRVICQYHYLLRFFASVVSSVILYVIFLLTIKDPYIFLMHKKICGVCRENLNKADRRR